jgi:ubiquitin C-terminal hydrolase
MATFRQPYLPALTDRDPDLQAPPRIQNFSASCYVNAALQCLLSIDFFREYFSRGQGSAIAQGADPLALCYRNLQVAFCRGSTWTILEGYLRQLIEFLPQNMDLHHQEDLEEFLGRLLDSLRESLTRLQLADNAVDYFCGDTSLVIRTACCDTVAEGEPFWILSTPIVPDPDGRLSLSYCLDALWASEEVTLERCPGCGHLNLVETPDGPRIEPCRGTRKRVLVRTPSCLIVHLMRFMPSWAKDGRHVEFAEEISLPVLSSDENPQVAKYSLKAVAELGGESAGGGHYRAFVRLGSTWHMRSDELGGIVTSAEVLRCRAYVLFYEKFADPLQAI